MRGESKKNMLSYPYIQGFFCDTLGVDQVQWRCAVMEFAIQSTLTAREIKKVREDLGLRQKDFAALANVSAKTVERWESGGTEITGPVVTL